MSAQLRLNLFPFPSQLCEKKYHLFFFRGFRALSWLSCSKEPTPSQRRPQNFTALTKKNATCGSRILSHPEPAEAGFALL
jgi:hypothetical protein